MGLNQSEFADEIGVDQSTISKWERGYAVPAREHLVPLARAMNVPVSVLLELSVAAAVVQAAPEEPQTDPVLARLDQIIALLTDLVRQTRPVRL